MSLSKCERPDCRPVEQTRGVMGDGDYADVVRAHRFVTPVGNAVNGENAAQMHSLCEMNDSIRDDVRVCCLTCGRATGWNKRDVPGMPGVGIDFNRKLWNELVPHEGS